MGPRDRQPNQQVQSEGQLDLQAVRGFLPAGPDELGDSVQTLVERVGVDV